MTLSPAARARYEAIIANMLKPPRIEPLWMQGGASIALVDAGAANPTLKVFDTESGQLRVQAELGGAPAEVRIIDREHVGYRIGDKRFVFSIATAKARELSSEEVRDLARFAPRVTKAGYPMTRPNEMEHLSPDKRLMLSIKDYNVCLRDTSNAEERSVTQGGTDAFRWSTETAQWSPDSRYVALRKTDERHVYRTPVTDWPSATLETYMHVYPRPGGALQVPHLFVVDVMTGKVRSVPGDDENSHLFILGFSADSRELRYARMPRTSKSVELCAYDVASDAVRTLLHEEARTFLYWPATFVLMGPPVHFLKDGRFVWQSEATGLDQLYLHDRDGTLIRQLTDADFPVTGVAAIDERNARVFFRAQPDHHRPYDVHLFCVDFAGGGLRRLSHDKGAHEARLSPDGRRYIDIHSAVDRAPSAELRSADDGALISLLWEADIRWLAALKWIAPEEFSVKAADGATDLYGVIVKPYDFDPSRKYPVVEHIYAGAQSSICPTTFDGGARLQQAMAIAQHGYVVVMLDGRGTPGRGKAFQDVVYRRLGDFEIADHAAALRQLGQTRSYMDMDRVGIFGGSFGGYFSIRALIQAGDLYKSAAAFGPAELGTLTLGVVVEGYMGLPQDNPEHYARSMNSDKVAAITGELMIIITTDDVNTPFSQTLLYCDAFRRAGKQIDLVVMPGFNHAIMNAKGEAPLLYLHDAIARHFGRTL